MRTDLGWKQARDIKPGMRIATGDPVPSRSQKELIVGSLLGDASLTLIRNRATFRLGHCAAQRDWLQFKMDSLQGFSWTGYSETSRHVIGVNSRGSLGLRDLRFSWYPNGKKVVDRQSVEECFGPRMLATWYCDDGTLVRHKTKRGIPTRSGAKFYTNGFTVEDCEWLAGLLTSKGFPATVQSPFHTSRDRSYPIVVLGVDAAERLFESIGRFVPPSMRYKLPLSAPAFDPSSAELEPAGVFYDKVVESKERDHLTPLGKRDLRTYHIGVEGEHNFLAAGLISHNTQDNGGFVNIVRTANDRGAPVVTLHHLDSARCWRTGVYDQPVIYWDSYQTPHVLQDYQIEDFVDFPAPEDEAFGGGLCACSRIIEDARYMRDTAIFAHEKVAGRNPRAIHFVGGVSGRSVRKALEEHKELSERKGQMYIDPPIIPGNDPTSTVSKVTLEMASLYDGFSEDSAKRWFYQALANALGVDSQDLVPLPAGNLGTSQQSNNLSMKGNTKGPALFQLRWTHFMNYKGILPGSVEFTYAERDPVLELQALQKQKLRVGNLVAMLGTAVAPGFITPEVARQLAVQSGDLPPEILGLFGEQVALPQLLSVGPGGG